MQGSPSGKACPRDVPAGSLQLDGVTQHCLPQRMAHAGILLPRRPQRDCGSKRGKAPQPGACCGAGGAYDPRSGHSVALSSATRGDLPGVTPLEIPNTAFGRDGACAAKAGCFARWTGFTGKVRRRGAGAAARIRHRWPLRCCGEPPGFERDTQGGRMRSVRITAEA